MDIPTTPGWHFIVSHSNRKKKPSLMYYIPLNPCFNQRIAAFDFVNTLIWSDRGDYTVRGGSNKWVWRSEEIPNFLSQLDWTIVIFSNYISKDFDELQERVEQVMRDVTKPIFFFASLANDEYKKPNIGMWHTFTSIWQKLTGKELIFDRKRSFYIGDRAGFSDAEDPMFSKGGVDVSKEELAKLNLPPETELGDDSLFAARIGLIFFLPSELPSQPLPYFPPDGNQELIIMVGQQGSGKTFWSSHISKHLDYYHLVAEETTGERVILARDKRKKLLLVKEFLKEGKNLIVDATHPSKASRKEIIAIAEKLNVPVRIFWITRPGRYYNDLRASPVHNIALCSYTKNFERPDQEEEGAEVIRLV